jgi:hypothetical protein
MNALVGFSSCARIRHFRNRDRERSERLVLVQELLHQEMPVMALPQGIDDDVGIEGKGFIYCEIAFGNASPTPVDAFSPMPRIGVVLVLPGARRLLQRLFLARDEERLADRLRDEAATAALLDQTIEVRADFFGKRDVGAERAH